LITLRKQTILEFERIKLDCTAGELVLEEAVDQSLDRLLSGDGGDDIFNKYPNV
jgi:asparagine synthetase B (glutamine-hydrolysing)